MDKAKEVGIDEAALYDLEDPVTGNIPLFSVLVNGNEKLFDSMMESVDRDDKKEVERLINYRNYSDESLLHAACTAGSERLKYVQEVMKLAQFQKERETLMMAKNFTGVRIISLSAIFWLYAIG